VGSREGDIRFVGNVQAERDEIASNVFPTSVRRRRGGIDQ